MSIASVDNSSVNAKALDPAQNIVAVLTYLLLNRGLLKVELARYIGTSVATINQLLLGRKINFCYERYKLFGCGSFM